MGKMKKDVKNEVGKTPFDSKFSISSILNEVNSDNGTSGENTESFVDDNSSCEEKEIVSETQSETIETNKDKLKKIDRGNFKDYLSVYQSDRNSKVSIYVHEEVANMLTDLKKRLVKDDNGNKYYVWDLANAMIYGFFMEHRDEIKEMMIKLKKRKSLLD